MSKKKSNKIDWSKELHASHIISRIESYLNTYWDEEYIIWKIKKEIKEWRES